MIIARHYSVYERKYWKQVFLLSSNSNENFSIYIDESILVVKDGSVTRIIESDDLYTFFEKIRGLISVLRNIVDDSNTNELVETLLCEEVYNTLDSLIIEGTLSKLLVDHVSGDFVKMPKELRDGTGYISRDGNKSELKNLIGLFQVASFKISKLLDDSAIRNRLYSAPALVIDHHETPDNLNFPHESIIEICPACAEIIYHIAKGQKLDIGKEAAEVIFQGILSDTLGLTSATVTAETFEIAAELTRLGADISSLEDRRREFMKKSPRR